MTGRDRGMRICAAMAAALALAACTATPNAMRAAAPDGNAHLPLAARAAADCVATALEEMRNDGILTRPNNKVLVTASGAAIYGTTPSQSIWLIDFTSDGAGGTDVQWRVDRNVLPQAIAQREIAAAIERCRAT